MNRLQRADDFLKYIREIYNYNPNVYGSLTIYGANRMAPSQDKPLASFFPQWIEHFKDNSNIKVFVSEKHKYFCQFVNGYVEPHSCIKMYVPLDYAHIQEGAKGIFDFLARNNISHESKIGSGERIDNIVIRVGNKEDAAMIANFINTNEFIKSGLMPCSPFCLSDGNIAYTADSYLSFNDVLCEYINEYVGLFQNDPSFGLEHFKNFLIEKYSNYFINGKQLDLLINNTKDKRYRFEGDITALLVNYQQISELIINQLAPSFDLNQYYKYVESLKQEYHTKDNYNRLRKLQNKEFNDETEKTDNPRLDILRDIIMINYTKYGLAQVSGAFRAFMRERKISMFTKDNNSRQKIASFSQEEILELIKKNGVENLEDFIKGVTGLDKDYLKTAVLETFRKYGVAQAEVAIKQYMLENNPSFFTNDNKARTNVINNVPSANIYNELLRELMSSGTIGNKKSLDENISEYVAIITNQNNLDFAPKM